MGDRWVVEFLGFAEFWSMIASGKHCPGTWGEAWEAKSRLRE